MLLSMELWVTTPPGGGLLLVLALVKGNKSTMSSSPGELQVKMEGQETPRVSSGDRSHSTPDGMGVSFHGNLSFCLRHACVQRHFFIDWLGDTEPVEISIQCTFCQEKKRLFSPIIWYGCNIYCWINLWIRISWWVNMSKNVVVHQMGFWS